METRNMDYKILGIIIIGILFSYNSFCQTNFLPGYIINLNKDTIKGFIDYRNWEKNPSEVTFKTELNATRIKYKSTEIKGFSVLDERYESAIVEKESNLNSIGDGAYDANLKTDMDTIFLQNIIAGRKSLFYLKDKNGIEQFYIKQDTSYTLLIYKRYLKIQEEQNGIMENRKFIGQLIQYLQDCSGIQDRLKNTKYKRTDFENLFLSYYNCTNSSATFYKKAEKAISQLGSLFGVSNTTLKFISDDYYLATVKFKASNMISAGLSCDFILPGSQRKWSINNELIYTAYKLSGHYGDFYNPATIDIGYAYIKINNMLRYTYPIGKSFTFVNVGISNGTAIHYINKKQDESIFHPNTVSRAIMETRGYEQGYILGIGEKFKSYSLEIRYEKGNGISVYQNLGTPTKRLYFFLGYKF